MKYTPNYISELGPCEVFVFGSNAKGEHRGGAARQAYLSFGAEWNVAEGMTGQCYAIPTLDENYKRVSPQKLYESLKRFVQYAVDNKEFTFLVTKIGCGIACWKIESVAHLLYIAMQEVNGKQPANIVIPEEFVPECKFRLDVYDAFYNIRFAQFLAKIAFTENFKQYISDTIRDYDSYINDLIDSCD